MPSPPLHTAVHGVANASTPAAAAQAVLDVCLAATGATEGRVHLLDLDSARYRPYAPGGTESVAAPQAGSFDVPTDDGIISLARFAGTELPPGAAHNGRTGSVVLSYRGWSCIGAISLHGPQPDALTEDVRQELRGLAGLLVPIFEDQFALRLLATFQYPLDFGMPENDFFADLSLLVSESTGMEFALVWEHADDAFRCIATWPLVEEADLRALTIDDAPAIQPMTEVLEGGTKAFTGREGSQRLQLPSLPALKPMQSCVLMPIVVGTSRFGVLALGARCAFDYAQLELKGFESVANGVGVAIANFRSSHKLSARVGQWTESSVAITAIEVAQAARHEAAGLIDNCQSILASTASSDVTCHWSKRISTSSPKSWRRSWRPSSACDRRCARRSGSSSGSASEKCGTRPAPRSWDDSATSGSGGTTSVRTSRSTPPRTGCGRSSSTS